MTPEAASQLVRDALTEAFWLSLPLLGVMFIAGLILSLVQIVTSIQDSAVSSVPRLACALVALVLSLPWMLRHAMDYAAGLLGNLSRYGH